MSDEQLRRLERAYVRAGLDYRVVPGDLFDAMIKLVRRCCDFNHGNRNADSVRQQLEQFLIEDH